MSELYTPFEAGKADALPPWWAVDLTGLTVAADTEGKLVVAYLGYRLPLSESETRLLLCLLEAGGRDVPAEVLGAAVSREHPASAETVSTLVGRINRKAKALGGRPLLCGRSHHGFSLAEEL